jgi:hypothetical protein
MRKIHILGFALLAVFAFGASVVSSAFAVELLQYLVNGATVALATSVNVVILPEGNKLKLEDTSQGVGVECLPAETSLGFVLSNGEGETTTASCASVTVVKGSCPEATVEAVNLPWTTALSEPTANVFEGALKSSVAAGPGWLVLCTVLGIDVDDICTTQNGKVLLTNEADGLIHVEFMTPAQTEKANCSVGSKKEVGTVEGLFFLHALESLGELTPLALSLAEEVA